MKKSIYSWKLLLAFVALLAFGSCSTTKQTTRGKDGREYNAYAIAFYNLENLYDYEDDHLFPLLYVRNSKYATFANDIMPKGNGTVVGILSKFNADYQLFLRSADDCYGFSGKEPITGGGNSGGTVTPTPSTGSVIYQESFASDFGKMVAVSISGDQEWKINTQYKNVNISGFANGTNNANEDWLLTPALDLTNAKSASISFDHTISQGKANTVAQAKMKEEQTLWVSSNYQGDVKSATWEQLTITSWPSGSDWKTVPSGNIALPNSMLGQPRVVLAFKYTSTADHSSTWQLQNLKVNSNGGKLATAN